MNKEQREQLASDLLAEAEHRRGSVVDLLRNAAAALSAPPAAQVQGEQPDRYQSPAYCQGLEQERDYLRTQLQVARKGFPGMVELAKEIAQLRAALSAPPAAGVTEAVHVLRKAYEGNSAGLFNSGAPNHLWSAAMLELFESLDEEVQEDARETVMAHADMRTVAALDRVIELLAAPAPPESEQQLAIVLPERRTEYVGDRDNLQWARGANFMLGEFLRLNPHLQPAAPAQGGEA